MLHRHLHSNGDSKALNNLTPSPEKLAKPIEMLRRAHLLHTSLEPNKSIEAMSGKNMQKSTLISSFIQDLIIKAKNPHSEYRPMSLEQIEQDSKSHNQKIK
jgi:hypothetical protein